MKTLMPASGEIHVWRASLDQPPSLVTEYFASLSSDERERAARFYFPRDRNHFTVCRGILRAILGRYLSVPPGKLRFRYNGHGKPLLAGKFGGDRICFNLSHSQGLALFAVTFGLSVGVDLERIRFEMEVEHVAERFFSTREVSTLRALPGHLRREAFFTCWTRKEAYVKALGKGLSVPLDRFDVSLIPGESAALLEMRGNPREASRWWLQELSPGQDYVGALAGEGHLARLECWEWRH